MQGVVKNDYSKGHLRTRLKGLNNDKKTFFAIHKNSASSYLHKSEFLSKEILKLKRKYQTECKKGSGKASGKLSV